MTRSSNAVWLAPALVLGCGDSASGSDAGSRGEDSGTVADADPSRADASADGGADAGNLDRFSFFVTSLRAIQELSGSEDGFGGDLRYGETGPGAGLRGADRICAQIADRSMPGSSVKGWRAFLSTAGHDGADPVDAIDRVGDGPWYDRRGRVFAMARDDLASREMRPPNCDPAICNDFPNEDGVPNHAPDPTDGEVDNHDTLTGSNADGRLYSNTATCLDWTTTDAYDRPRVGHSWPRIRRGGPGGEGDGYGHWISSLDEAGCRPGVNLIEMGGPGDDGTVGSGGGYGGFYCFALTP
jgi:hypothetical protein